MNYKVFGARIGLWFNCHYTLFFDKGYTNKLWFSEITDRFREFYER